MMTLDHIAVACTDLDEGAAWLESRLGVPLAPGGRHPLMGTHNRLLSLGPDSYLELIAIDPAAPPPSGARWFGLDDFAGPPRIAGWVVRAPDSTPAPPGARWVTAARGNLRWRITVADCGRMGHDGIAPSMIDWGTAPPPPAGLPDRGVRLVRLALSHPDPLDPLPGDARVTVSPGPPGMAATLAGPLGEVVV